MPYHHGLLNQPDPDRPWGRPPVPQSLISAAEEWGRNPQRPMVSPQGASIGPPQSRMSRIWDHLRHGIPRRVEEFLEPETPAGLAGLLGASVMEPAGTAIDVADFAAGFRDRDLPRMGWAAGGAALPFVAGSTMRKVLGKGVKGADELPMDEASRMGRAEEMEFDLDVYHGTPEDIKGPFRESGFAPELGYGEIGSGVYVAPNPKDVERYTTNARSLHPSDPNVTTGSIHPLRVRSKKLLSSDSPEFKELVDDVIHNDPYFGPKTRDKTGPYFQPGGWGYSEASERARKLAAERGWEGFYEPREEYINRRWVKLPDAKDSRQIVIFDPKNLRSRWAAFDPRERHSPNPLAGIAPLLGIGAAGAARRNYVERER